jgi:hypothetical protein
MYYEGVGIAPMGTPCQDDVGLFGMTLGKVWLVCGIVLLSGTEVQEF